MQAEKFSAIYGGEVEVDVCHHCNGLWFDGRESLQLAPGSTLKLFASMYGRKASAHQPLVPSKSCPRCSKALVETFDMQRGTRFTYFRCEAHGRYTTFFQFLREKNLVRAPTPKQLAELKATVQQVDCSNCGAPIVLAQTVTCLHCAAPVSILSEDSINKTLEELQQKEAKRTTVDPNVAARLVMDQLKAINHDNAMKAPLTYQWSPRGTGRVSGDLVELGARALVGLIAGLLD
jgi:hypothetical protein